MYNFEWSDSMGNNSSFQVNIMAPLIVGVLGVAFIIVFVVLCVRACREKNSARNRVHIVIDDINRRNLDNKTQDQQLDNNLRRPSLNANALNERQNMKKAGLKQFLLMNRGWILDYQDPASRRQRDLNNVQQVEESVQEV